LRFSSAKSISPSAEKRTESGQLYCHTNLLNHLLTLFSYYSCFPHVVNLGVKATMAHISTSTAAAFISYTETVAGYISAFCSDPIKKCGDLVHACCASGQHQAELKQTIWDFNAGCSNPVDKLPDLQLLRDVDTWWSSMYLMIKRVLTLFPVCSL
jgi:hypothetical protein